MPERLTEIDRVQLSLAHEKINHLTTKEALLAAEKREATAHLVQLSDALTKKYALGDDDTVDVRDGSIKRAVAVTVFPKTE